MILKRIPLACNQGCGFKLNSLVFSHDHPPEQAYTLGLKAGLEIVQHGKKCLGILTEAKA